MLREAVANELAVGYMQIPLSIGIRGRIGFTLTNRSSYPEA